MSEKSLLRAKIKELTKALDDEYISESDRGILSRLLALPAFIQAKRVFVYCSVGKEPDTRELIRFCLETGKSLFLPRSYAGGRMDFAVLDCPVEALPKGRFGIPQPPETLPAVEAMEGDIIIVPALCFDERLFRLGHGGGYYDRFLDGTRAVSIGLCRERLVLDSLPTEPFDRPVDLLVTEKKVRNR